MTQRIMSAQAILREKGYVPRKFDTNGFMEAVAKYFLENSIESRLLLLGERFIDLPDIPDDFDFDGTKDEKLSRCFYDIRISDKARGFKAEYEKDADGNLVYVAKLSPIVREVCCNFGALRARIIVDKPYLKNAASLLSVMGGYVVEKTRLSTDNGCHLDGYEVTLI